jgi:hypothetical protein
MNIKTNILAEIKEVPICSGYPCRNTENIATFFCNEHREFLCHNCFHSIHNKTQSHVGHHGADSIKSLLSKHLVLWRDLMAQAAEASKFLNKNLLMENNLIQFLQTHSPTKPSINPLRLPRVLDVFKKILQKRT